MPVKLTKDGRTIRTGKAYTTFRYELWLSQNKLCADCGRQTELHVSLHWDNSFHVDHTRGRAGGKRDDQFYACTGKCGKCHRIKHHQQSTGESKLHWSRP